MNKRISKLWNITKESLGFLEWWLKNSIIRNESYSSLYLKKKYPSLKFLMIILWPLEWIASGLIEIFSFMIVFCWIAFPIMVLMSIMLIAMGQAKLTGILGLIVMYVVVGILVWLITKLRSGMEKLRKALS